MSSNVIPFLCAKVHTEILFSLPTLLYLLFPFTFLLPSLSPCPQIKCQRIKREGIKSIFCKVFWHRYFLWEINPAELMELSISIGWDNWTSCLNVFSNWHKYPCTSLQQKNIILSNCSSPMFYLPFAQVLKSSVNWAIIEFCNLLRTCCPVQFNFTGVLYVNFFLNILLIRYNHNCTSVMTYI